MKTFGSVKNSDIVKRIVARCIAARVCRSACWNEVAEVADYLEHDERQLVSAYVIAEYDAAGAGFAGRWQ